MPITLDATSTGEITNATSHSFSHTVGTAARYTALFAAASLREDGSATLPANIVATYNGVAMTQVGEYGNATWKIAVALFYLLKPTAGANTLAFSWSNASLGGFYGISLYGVSYNNPIRTSSYTAGTGASIDVPSAVADRVLDVISAESPFGGTVSMTVGAGQTAIMNDEIQRSVNMAYGGSYEAGASGNVTMSWTKSVSNCLMAGMSVVPASGARAVAVSPFLSF